MNKKALKTVFLDTVPVMNRKPKTARITRYTQVKLKEDFCFLLLLAILKVASKNQFIFIDSN